MIPLRGYLVPLLAVLVLLAIGVRARAADENRPREAVPPGLTIDCPTIRSYVAEHGKARALAWAIENGYGWKEIAAARRCLK